MQQLIGFYSPALQSGLHYKVRSTFVVSVPVKLANPHLLELLVKRQFLCFSLLMRETEETEVYRQLLLAEAAT